MNWRLSSSISLAFFDAGTLCLTEGGQGRCRALGACPYSDAALRSTSNLASIMWGRGTGPALMRLAGTEEGQGRCLARSDGAGPAGEEGSKEE